MSNKRLYKSTVNCMLCGVCGGIAEYFDIDPTLVRLAWIILTCFGGAGDKHLMTAAQNALDEFVRQLGGLVFEAVQGNQVRQLVRHTFGIVQPVHPGCATNVGAN